MTESAEAAKAAAEAEAGDTAAKAAAVAAKAAAVPVKAAAVPANATTALRIAIAGLFLIYTTPLFALAFAYFFQTNHFKNNDVIALSLFSGFVGSSDESFALIHRALMPLMAGMAPIAFRDDSSSRWSTGLMIALLFAIATSILLNAAFHNPEYLNALATASLFNLPEIAMESAAKALATTAAMQPVYSFFARTQEVMSMYLLLLFGLTLNKATT